MANPALALNSSMVFTLPFNASQALYPENIVTDFRVALPECVALRSNDLESALASFTYACTWYNVPDVAGQTRMASFNFLPSHLHPPSHGDDHTESAAAETEGTPETPSSQDCEGSTFIKSPKTLALVTMNILHNLNGHGGSSQMAFQLSYHAVRNRVLVAFRPGLKDCMGQVMLTRALSLLLGWQDQEKVLMGRDNICHMAPSQPRRDPVGSLFMHCDLAAATHVVGNVRSCLLGAVPAKGCHGLVVCFEPQRLDWLPVRCTEFQHVHMVITDSQDQKVPFEGGTCAVKLLLRWRGSYFWL